MAWDVRASITGNGMQRRWSMLCSSRLHKQLCLRAHQSQGGHPAVGSHQIVDKLMHTLSHSPTAFVRAFRGRIPVELFWGTQDGLVVARGVVLDGGPCTAKIIMVSYDSCSCTMWGCIHSLAIANCNCGVTQWDCVHAGGIHAL